MKIQLSKEEKKMLIEALKWDIDEDMESEDDVLEAKKELLKKIRKATNLK